MKIARPLVTLLSGAAVGVAVLIASTLSTPATPSVRNQAATVPAPAPTVIVTLPPASSATVVTLPPPASSAPAAAPTTTPATAATIAPAVTPTASASSPYAGSPANAGYAGEADGGAWVSISVRGRQATAYARTGYGQARLYGTAAAGVLYLTGQDGDRLDADYDAARAVGYVIADGIRYAFSAPAVRGTASSSQSAA